MNSIVNEVFNDVINKDSGPSRGKRLCPECNKHVGVRLRVCYCGHQFVKGETKQATIQEVRQQENQLTDEEKMYALSVGARGGELFIYSGRECPAKLEGLDSTSVHNFCNEVVFEGLNENKVYSVQAIKGFAQHRFGYGSEEYRTICEAVDQWYNETIGIDRTSGEEYNENS